MSQDKTVAPPVYLLPGLICNATIWEPVAEALAGRGVVCIDGYGEARSLGRMAEQVLAAAPARLAVAGHSMGGRVALEMFRLAPERIARLALLDTGVHPREPGEREKRMALVRLGRESGMEALVDAWLPPMVRPDRREEEGLMAPLKAMCCEAGMARFEAQVEALLERPDATPLLGRIDCPALVATGRFDGWSPVAQHEKIAARIPGARLVIFEEAGHMAPFETPAAVAAALQAWLDD